MMVVCRSKAVTTHLVARASGANFAMYMAELKAGGEAGKPAKGAERCVGTHLPVCGPNAAASTFVLCQFAKLSKFSDSIIPPPHRFQVFSCVGW